MSIVITRLVQTCYACPSQWDSWTESGQYLYLRYRHGFGTVSVGGSPVITFEHGDDLDGVIGIYEFADLAGLTIAVGAHDATA